MFHSISTVAANARAFCARERECASSRVQLSIVASRRECNPVRGFVSLTAARATTKVVHEFVACMRTLNLTAACACFGRACFSVTALLRSSSVQFLACRCRRNRTTLVGSTNTREFNPNPSRARSRGRRRVWLLQRRRNSESARTDRAHLVAVPSPGACIFKPSAPSASNVASLRVTQVREQFGAVY